MTTVIYYKSQGSCDGGQKWAELIAFVLRDYSASIIRNHHHNWFRLSSFGQEYMQQRNDGQRNGGSIRRVDRLYTLFIRRSSYGNFSFSLLFQMPNDTLIW